MSVTLAVGARGRAGRARRAGRLVAPFFADDRPLRGAAGRVDWRLCGLLATRSSRGRLPSELGEAVLCPSGGRLRAPRACSSGSARARARLRELRAAGAEPRQTRRGAARRRRRVRASRPRRARASCPSCAAALLIGAAEALARAPRAAAPAAGARRATRSGARRAARAADRAGRRPRDLRIERAIVARRPARAGPASRRRARRAAARADLDDDGPRSAADRSPRALRLGKAPVAPSSPRLHGRCVRRSARASRGAAAAPAAADAPAGECAMSLVGSLEDLGLGDILQIVHLSRKSGMLWIRSDAGEGQIVFARG